MRMCVRARACVHARMYVYALGFSSLMDGAFPCKGNDVLSYFSTGRLNGEMVFLQETSSCRSHAASCTFTLGLMEVG